MVQHPAEFIPADGAVRPAQARAGASSPDLFHDEVPLLTPSLARHGLVDLSTAPTQVPRFRNQPQSSEDLRDSDVDANEEDDGEGEWVRAGGPEDGERDDGGLDALLGVNNIVVGHYRAAAELRRTLISPGSLRDPLRTRGEGTTAKTTATVPAQGAGKGLPRKRSAPANPFSSTLAERTGSVNSSDADDGSSTANGSAVGGAVENNATAKLADGHVRGTPGPGHSAEERVASRLASAAASAAVAAALNGKPGHFRRKSHLGSDDADWAGGGGSGGGNRSPSSDEESHTSSMEVSMSAVLDIAVKLFGSNISNSSMGSGTRKAGSGHRRDGSGGKAGRSNGTSSGSGGGGRGELGLATFTVNVNTDGSTKLGISVKELGGGAVVVQDLHRSTGDIAGPAERAGVALGDVILGINYRPLEKGLIHTAIMMADAIKRVGFVKLQISRQVMVDGRRRQTFPGRDCPVVTDLMWRTARLRRAGILDSAERQAIAGFILQLMAWDEGTSLAPPPPPPMTFPLSLFVMKSPPKSATLAPGGNGKVCNKNDSALSHEVSPSPSRRHRPKMSVMRWATSAQLDSLVLRVKGLREAIYVRCLHAKSTFEPTKTSSVWGSPQAEGGAATTRATVRYVLRAEDIATGREWLVFPRYSDFSELHQELLALWPPIADLPFPTKRPVTGLLLGASAVGSAVVEERIVGLEAFLHGALTLLGIYAAVDPRCTGCLRLIEDFLGMPKDLFEAENVLAPTLCHQKRVEVLLYKLLNQVDSPVARVKNGLMRDFDPTLARDVDSLMNGTALRLVHLQECVSEQHQHQLSSYLERSDVYPFTEAKNAATQKAVRRQVELSFFLPLRRCLCHELASRLKGPNRNLQRAIKALRRSPPSVFGVEYPDILSAEKWGPAREAMGQATRRVLPTDQIEGLVRAAEHIAALHASLQQSVEQQRAPTRRENPVSNRAGTPGNDADAPCTHMGTSACANVGNVVLSENLFDGDDGNRYRSDTHQDGLANGGSYRVSDDGRRHRAGAGRAGEESEARRTRLKNTVDDGGNIKQACLERRSLREGSAERSQECAQHNSPRRRRASKPPEWLEVDAGPDNVMGHARNIEAIGGKSEGEAKDDNVQDNGRNSMLLQMPFDVAKYSRTTTTGRSGAKATKSEDETVVPQSPICQGNVNYWERAGTSASGRSTSNGHHPLNPGDRSPCSEGNGAAVAVAACNFDKIEEISGEAGGCRASDKGGREVQQEGSKGGKTICAMGADDFLPLFALALVHSAPLDLLIPQTLLANLMDTQGSLSEEGYLVATLEAAVSFVTQVYNSTCCADGQQVSP